MAGRTTGAGVGGVGAGSKSPATLLSVGAGVGSLTGPGVGEGGGAKYFSQPESPLIFGVAMSIHRTGAVDHRRQREKGTESAGGIGLKPGVEREEMLRDAKKLKLLLLDNPMCSMAGVYV